MLKIAIVGNIAAGKSTVESILQKKGFSVYDTDILSHEILEKENIRVSLFIDPDIAQIQAAKEIGASVIELHTGRYADAVHPTERNKELQRIKEAAIFADKNGFCVNAGHGLNIHNVADIARLPEIQELNIGHAIIAQALFLGLSTSVKQMKTAIFQAKMLK